MKKKIISIVLLLFIAYYNVNSQTEITFYTTKGNFTVKMYDSITPITSGNFISLVNSKFYDGIIFHRVINNFMIQGGCPLGTGYGGPGYTIPDEFDSTLSNIQKTISMANSGPNTGGSQFFINLVNNTYLDYNKPPYTSAHPVFGIVISNFSVVQTIGAVPVNINNNKPLTPVIMDSLRVTFSPFTQIDKHSTNSNIDIYPNPSSENIFFKTTINELSQIEIYRITGEKLFETKINPLLESLEIKSFENGIYFGKLITSNKTYIFKFIKN